MLRSGVCQWIQCSRCLKWRSIPVDANFANFFGKWECNLNKWSNPAMGCEIPEDIPPPDNKDELILESISKSYGPIKSIDDFGNFLKETWEMNQLSPKANEFMINNQYISLMDFYYTIQSYNGIENCNEDDWLEINKKILPNIDLANNNKANNNNNNNLSMEVVEEEDNNEKKSNDSQNILKLKSIYNTYLLPLEMREKSKKLQIPLYPYQYHSKYI